MKEMQK